MDQKNNKFVKITLWVIAIVLIIPLVNPIPPPEGTLPIEQLADPDSSFIQINEVQFHYKNSGSGETALVFLHGFGASLYSWREVMPVFAEDYAVFAYDRPAFGLTERPVTWTGENPYSTQASISQLDSLFQIGLRGQNHEFFAPIPPHGIDLPTDRSDGLGHTAQAFIPRLMAAQVVVGLEMVHINHQDTVRAAVTLEPLMFLDEVLTP